MVLRAIVADEFNQLALLRVHTEDEYLLVMARGISQLKAAWETARAGIDSLVAGNPISNEVAQAQRAAIIAETESLKRQAEQTLSAWQMWPQITVQRINRRVLASVVWRRRIKPFDATERRAVYVNHGVEQLRAIENEARFEPSLERVEHAILSALRLALERRGRMITLSSSRAANYLGC